MGIAILATIILVVVNNHETVPTGFRKCSSDLDCMHSEFCNNLSKFCSSCVTCSRYGRVESILRCAKIPSDCGDCLPGKIEIQQYDKDKKLIRCGQNNTLGTIEAQKMDDNVTIVLSPSWTIAVIFCLGLILATGSCVAFKYIKYISKVETMRNNRVRVTRRNSIPPPPYASDENSTSIDTDGSTNHVGRFQLNVTETSDYINPKAVPFRLPFYLTESCEDDGYAYSDNSDASGDESVVGELNNNISVVVQEERTNASQEIGGTSSGPSTAGQDSSSQESNGCRDMQPPAKRQRLDRESEDNKSEDLHINLVINQGITLKKD